MSNEKDTTDTTQDMKNKISHYSQAVAREMASSKQALGSFMSKPRVWLEYGWSMGRVWLELVLVVLIMVVGVSGVRAQDYSGTYYIGSRGWNENSPITNFYFCPTEGWIYYNVSAEYNYTDDDNGQPFMTTYQYRDGFNDAKAVWIIEKHPSEDYYYIKYNDGRYLTYNNSLNSGGANRLRLHLETTASPNNNMLFAITQPAGTYYLFSPKAKSGWYFCVNQGNVNSLQGSTTAQSGQSPKTDGPTGHENDCNGIWGLYNKDMSTNANMWLYLEEVKCATPTISYNNSTGELTITSTTVGATIKYTIDGTDPSSGTTYDDSNKPVISTRTVVKAIAQKTYKEDSEVITQTIVVSPVIDPIASVIYNGTAQEPTVTVKDGETVISDDEYNVAYTNNTNAGTATVTITDKEGGDYIVNGSSSFTITQKALTITAEAKSKTYGDADPALTYTSVGLVEGDAITGALTRAAGETVNTYAITQGTLTAGDNYAISYTGANLTITQKALTITADSDTKEYNGTALTKNSYTHTDLISGDVIISVTVTGSQTDRGESDNVPSAALIKNNNGNGDDVTACYDITYVNGTLSVTGRVITITAGSDTKVYDGTPLTNDSYTHVGTLFSGDVITSVTVTGSQIVAGSSYNVPSAAVIMNGGTDVSSNYDVTYVNGTLEVTQKALTITADDDTKVYDGTPLTKNTYTNTALATGDVIESVTMAGSQTDVGTSDNVPSAAVIKNGSNENVTSSYAITYVNGTLEVTRVPLTVTANNHTITYGDTPANNDVTYTGFVNNETSSVLGGELAYTYNYTQYGDVGTYTITPGGLTSDNYEITFAPGTLTVTQKEVGLEWGNTTLNYTGSVQAPTATATGTVNGDVIGVTVEGGQTDIGTGYTATATALTGEKAGNYKLPAENTIEFSIQTSTLTITANSYTIHYGDPRPNYAVTYEGFVNGDNASTLSGKLTYTCDYARGEDVGTYTITPKGLRSDKYEITFVAGTLTVNPKEVGLSWGNTTLTYTGTAQVPTATATGLVNDDEISITVEVTGDHTDVGGYTATATELTGTKVDNYTLPTANTTSFSIIEAPLTVTANNHTITYGDAPAANGVSYTGFVNNETSSVLGGDLSYAYDYNQYDDIVCYNENDEIVPYTITPSGLTATNYAIAFEAGTLTVNPKEVRLTWTGTSFPYDGEAHAPTVTMTEPETDLVHEDVITVNTPTLSANTGSSLEENGTAVQVGYYRATTSLTGPKAGNYKPVPAIQPFTISSLSIGDGNVPAEDIEITTTDGSSVTVTDGETILDPNTHYTVEIETQGVDHYITVTGKGNYSGSARILYVTPDFNRPTDDDTDYAAVYQAASDLAQPDGITPCIIKSVNPLAGTLTATPVDYLPKGVPVVLVAASDISGFQASAKPDNVTAITDQTKNSNLLKVSPTGGVTVAATQIYLFNAGEFVLTMPGTLPAGYFYLGNPNYHATGTTSGARYRLQMVIAPPTDINDGEWKMDDVGDDAWYTLDGRRLNGKPTRKGMYIANGKKIIIR